jgi:hypothetical protein
MPTASAEAPERQPRNPGRTLAPLPLRTSLYTGCREGFQSIMPSLLGDAFLPDSGHRDTAAILGGLTQREFRDFGRREPPSVLN